MSLPSCDAPPAVTRPAPANQAPPASSTAAPLRIVSGCPRGSRERLYAANTGLVNLILRRFPLLTGEAREEAYSAGLLGLWQAACRYDRARGFTFGTYAGDCIRHSIVNHLIRERRHSRLPTVSLETPISGSSGKDGGELADMIADPQAEKPGEVLVDAAGFEALIAGLTGRHEAVLRAVYQEGRTAAEVAGQWGLSRARVHQIHMQAIKLIRKRQRREAACEKLAKEQISLLASIPSAPPVPFPGWEFRRSAPATAPKARLSNW